MLFGGSEPPLGHRGRSIIIYTSHKITVETCEAPECIMLPHSNVDTRMIYCDAEMCERWIHFWCDPKVRNLKKDPEKYFCPHCYHIVVGRKR